MKLKIEKFLALTAMMATAQVGTFACVAADDADDAEQNVDEDDDAGAQTGDADDDTEADDDDTEADDDVVADAGDEGGGSDDDVVHGDVDAGPSHEGATVDAGPSGEGELPWDDAGAEGGPLVDGGAFADAGSEGIVWADGGLPEGDAAVEGSLGCLGDGSFDPAIEPTECGEMFDVCAADLAYYGTAASQCWEMAYYRTAAVYESFIGCVTDAAITDPCGEEGDVVVAQCAYEADYGACATEDPSCTAMAEACPEIDAVSCNAALAKYPSAERYGVTSCFDYIYATNSEMFGPGYEGCGYDYQSCLAMLGPSGE